MLRTPVSLIVLHLNEISSVGSVRAFRHKWWINKDDWNIKVLGVKHNECTILISQGWVVVIPIHNISCYAVKCGRGFSSTPFSITTECRGKYTEDYSFSPLFFTYYLQWCCIYTCFYPFGLWKQIKTRGFY